jgi:hypothetical protein
MVVQVPCLMSLLLLFGHPIARLQATGSALVWLQICFQHQARASFAAEVDILKPYANPDSIVNADRAVESSWVALLRARVTKLECMLTRALTKGSLSGKKLQKVLLTQQSAFVSDTKKWQQAKDPSEVVWAPLWNVVKEKSA